MSPGDTLALTGQPRVILVSWDLAWLLVVLIIIGAYVVLAPICHWIADRWRSLTRMVAVWWTTLVGGLSG